MRSVWSWHNNYCPPFDSSTSNPPLKNLNSESISLYCSVVPQTFLMVSQARSNLGEKTKSSQPEKGVLCFVHVCMLTAANSSQISLPSPPVPFFLSPSSSLKRPKRGIKRTERAATQHKKTRKNKKKPKMCWVGILGEPINNQPNSWRTSQTRPERSRRWLKRNRGVEEQQQQEVRTFCKIWRGSFVCLLVACKIKTEEAETTKRNARSEQ